MNETAREQALNEIKELRSAGRMDEAIGLARKLQEAHPSDATVSYQCASTYDRAGEEREAVAYYERALQQGLSGRERRGALLGLGSTYRNIGELERSRETFLKGLAEFDNGREFQVFLALTLFDLDECAEATQILLQNLAETTQDPHLKTYRRALLHYAGLFVVKK